MGPRRLPGDAARRRQRGLPPGDRRLGAQSGAAAGARRDAERRHRQRRHRRRLLPPGDRPGCAPRRPLPRQRRPPRRRRAPHHRPRNGRDQALDHPPGLDRARRPALGGGGGRRAVRCPPDRRRRHRLAPALRLHRRLAHRGDPPVGGLGGDPLPTLPELQHAAERQRQRRADRGPARPPHPRSRRRRDGHRRGRHGHAGDRRAGQPAGRLGAATAPRRPPRAARLRRQRGRRDGLRSQGRRRRAGGLRRGRDGRDRPRRDAPLRAAGPAPPPRRQPGGRRGRRFGVARPQPGPLRQPGGRGAPRRGLALRPRQPGLGAAQPPAARLAAGGLVRGLGGGRRVPGRRAAAGARRLRLRDPLHPQRHARPDRSAGHHRPDDLRRLPALLGQAGRRGRDRLPGHRRPDARARAGTTSSGARPGPITT